MFVRMHVRACISMHNMYVHMCDIHTSIQAYTYNVLSLHSVLHLCNSMCKIILECYNGAFLKDVHLSLMRISYTYMFVIIMFLFLML